MKSPYQSQRKLTVIAIMSAVFLLGIMMSAPIVKNGYADTDAKFLKKENIKIQYQKKYNDRHYGKYNDKHENKYNDRHDGKHHDKYHHDRHCHYDHDKHHDRYYHTHWHNHDK